MKFLERLYRIMITVKKNQDHQYLQGKYAFNIGIYVSVGISLK